MELWTGTLSRWKCHWPDLKSSGLFQRNLFLNSLKTSTLVFLVDCLSSENPVHVDHASAVKKGIINVCGLMCSIWPSWSLGHSSRSSFHRRSLEHQELRDLNWSAQPSPCCHDNAFLSDLLWDSHLQFLANNCMYSSHTDIKLCTYRLYRHTTLLIHEILIWPINSGVLTSLLLSHLSPSLTDSLPSLNLLCHLKTDARFMQDTPKAVWSIPYVSVASFFPGLKQNFIAYRSSKVSSCPVCIFEIDQLWQSGFSRVYSNCCCKCSFEPGILKIG